MFRKRCANPQYFNTPPTDYNSNAMNDTSNNSKPHTTTPQLAQN